MLRHIRINHGGDLFVLPGDINAGHWHHDEFLAKMEIYLGRSPGSGDGGVTAEEAIAVAGNNCYGTTKKLFTECGYEVLMAVGDHELGEWYLCFVCLVCV